MGVLLLLGLGIAALVFTGGGSGGGGGGTNCGRVVLTPDMVMGKLDLLSGQISSADPNGNGFEFVSRLMRTIYPSCPWARDTIATVVGPKGEVDWQTAVAAMGTKTVAELAADPEFEGVLSPGTEGVSAPGEANTIAAAARFVGISLPEALR